MTSLDLMKMSEPEARAYLESTRWPNGPVCPHCGSRSAFRLGGAAANRGVLKCRDCSKQFTVTIGTIFEGSKIALHIWLKVVHLMCASKKGVSAHQVHRMFGVTYKSAWFMVHRVRFAMKEGPVATMLRGTVEADETYIGPRAKGKPGRGAAKKMIVFALVQRNGRAHSRPVDRISSATLKGAIRERVHRASRMVTDDYSSYMGLGREFRRGHLVIHHTKGEYVRGPAHTNTAESYFALLKRGLHGTFHHVSRQHLHRYCDEFSFRWNTRKVTDTERTREAVRMTEGKRLMYLTSPSHAVEVAA